MLAESRIRFIKFHEEQHRVYKAMAAIPMGRFVFRAGRRFGKTTMFEEAAGNWALHGEKIGWFAPDYKLLSPSYKRIHRRLLPEIGGSNKVDGLIELNEDLGGSVEFWTLNNPDAGRSRNYDRVIIDEAGLIPKGLKEIWEQAIEPTLVDRGGSAYMTGTPKGVNEDSFFYQACTNPDTEWTQFHLPTRLNPTLNAEALEKIRLARDPLVWQQEYLAEFIDWRGVAFFSLGKWLDEQGNAYPFPTKCDSVFCVIDSAIKDGKEHDGTAVTYYARTKYGGIPLMILDWDIIQIKGAILEEWLPSVYKRLRELAEMCGARIGAQPPFIEDKASGTILLQQAERRGWPANGITTDLVEAGKDGRAFMASGPHYRGEVKITQFAYDKTVRFKGVQKNHLVSQVMGYRIGDKDASKRADDCYDTYVYGVSLALGDRRGH